MGIPSLLGYRHRPANPAQRAVQAAAATRAGAWLLARTLPRVDRAVDHLTAGRTSGPQVLTGLAVLMVTTTGRRSGRPRTTPLIAVPFGEDGLALLGTSFGQPATPAWVHNLEADPHATLAYQGRTCRATARPATPAEQEQVWEAGSRLYRGYAAYRERVGGRRIRVLVLQEAA